MGAIDDDPAVGDDLAAIRFYVGEIRIAVVWMAVVVTILAVVVALWLLAGVGHPDVTPVSGA